MSFITLTKAQADSVRGLSKVGEMLDPVEQKDGTFILPDVVLSDPAHAAKKSILQALPTKSAADNKVVPE